MTNRKLDSGRLALRLVLGACLLFVICQLSFALSPKGSGPLPDPVPLRRVLLPPEKLLGELKRVRDGLLLRMPGDEFEQLVQRAAQAKKQRQSPPQLIQARYRASLVETGGQAALVGTAEWKVLHSGTGPALLRLNAGTAFNLAVKKPRYENRDAVLAEFPDPEARAGEGSGRTLALLVDQPGEHTLTMSWSCAALSRPEGLQVELRVPASPATSLELELPAEYTLVAPADTLASGPHASEKKEHRLWRIACGGKTHLPLLIRRPDTARTAPVVLCWQHRTVQRLSPEGLSARTNLMVESLHQDVDTLVFEYDAPLRPLAVQTAYLKSFDVKAGAGNVPGILTVHLSRPVREAILEIRCLGPLASSRAPQPGKHLLVHWTSPALRLVHARSPLSNIQAPAIPRGESLELWLHPDLQLLSWQSGDFRLRDSAILTDPETQLTMRRLSLSGGGLASTRNGPRRPGGLIQAGGVEFSARQLSWWRLDREGMELTCQVDYEVLQGQLFQLALRLPMGWEPEQVELTPVDLLRGWVVREMHPAEAKLSAGKAGQVLVIDLRRPLSVGLKAEGGRKKEGQPASGTSLPKGRLTVRLRRLGQWINREVPFPDLVPLGVRFREGGLGIDFDEWLYQGSINSPLSTADPPGPELSGKRVPDYFYPFYDNGLIGSLRLKPRLPRFQARIKSDVYLTPDRGAVTTRLVFEAASGAPRHIDVYISGSEEKPRQWHMESAGLPLGNQVRRVERLTGVEVAAKLAPLAARSPVGAVVLQAARPTGTFWRLHLDRPLPIRQSVTLQTSGVLKAAPGEADLLRWDIPLPTVLHASRMEGEVSVQTAGIDLVASDGTVVRKEDARPTFAASGSAFRYTDAFARLSLQGRLGQGRANVLVQIDAARLTTLVTTQDVLRHHFRFRLRNWDKHHLPIVLPAGAQLLAGAVDGKWLAQLRPDENGTVFVPVPAGPVPAWVEVEYTTADQGAGGFRPVCTIEAPMPDLPVEPASCERRWVLPTGVRPIHETLWRPLPGSWAEYPPAWTGSVGHRLLEGLFRHGPVLRGLQRRDERHSTRLQALDDAIAALAGKRASDGPEQKVPLGEVVEELTSLYLRDLHPLVIDRVALERAGFDSQTLIAISPDAKVGRASHNRAEDGGPWKDTNLAIVPGRAALLLTTRTEMERWDRKGAEEAIIVPDNLESALRLAVGRGQDPSGRFLSVPEWQDAAPSSLLAPVLFPNRYETDGWTVWAPIASKGGSRSSDEGLLMVARHDAVSALGLIVLAGCIGVAVLLRRYRAQARLGLLLIWLGVAGLSLAWLPEALTGVVWWPFVGGLIVGGVWYLLWASRLPRSGPPSSVSRSGSRSSLSGPQSRTSPNGPVNQTQGEGPYLGSTTSVALLLALLLCPQLSEGQDTASERGTLAGPGEPELVYLIRAAGSAERFDVLVRPGLVDQLRQLARPSQAPSKGVVLVSASYEGRLQSTGQGLPRAEFTATFHVYSLGDEPATLILPLDGVKLIGDTLLDGARALPTALPPDPDWNWPGPRKVEPRSTSEARGFSLQVREKGNHKIQMRFQVPVSVQTMQPNSGQASGIKQVRFTAPPVVQSRLIFHAPGQARGLNLLGKHGGQRIVTEGGGQKLEAELGAFGAARAATSGVPLEVRWYQEGRGARPARVEFREAYLWDLHTNASLLTAFLRYSISSGAVNSLLIDLPEDLEVRSAVVRRAPASAMDPSFKTGHPAGVGLALPAPRAAREGRVPVTSRETGADLPPVRLSDWTVAGRDKRTLRLELAEPAWGDIEVTVELVPRSPWYAGRGGADPVLLPLPRPHGQPRADSPGYLAYRAHGLSADPRHSLRLTGIEAKDFAPFWPASSWPVPGTRVTLSYASRFRRDPRLSPELRLLLRPLLSKIQATQTISWTISDRNQALLAMEAELKTEGKDLSLVMWDLQSPDRPVVISAVTGPDVLSWSQSGRRLLLWLKKKNTTRIEISGWVPLSANGAPKGKELARLDLPCLRLVTPAQEETRLRLRPGPGLALTPKSLRQLKREPSKVPGHLNYLVRQPGYGGVFLVRRGPAPTVDVVTTVSIEDRTGGRPTLVLSSVINYRRQGELRSVNVRLRDWSGEAWLDAPPRTVARRREQNLSAGAGGVEGRITHPPYPAGGPERSWVLELVPGIVDSYQLKLRGRLPLEELASGLSLPELILGGTPVRQKLVLEGGLVVEGSSGVRKVASAAGTQAWQVISDDWELRVAPRELPRRAPVEVLLAEVRASYVEGGKANPDTTARTAGEGWVQQVRYWLQQERPADLALRWQHDVRIMSASIDGTEIPIAEPDRGRLWLPLVGPAGLRQVVVRYRHTIPESADRPDLTPPEVEGAPPTGLMVWTVDVPPGWEMAHSIGGLSLGLGTTRQAALELHRALVQLTISRVLASESRDKAPLKLAQRRFARSCWLAELALTAGADASHPAGPDGLPLADWLTQLQQQNQALARKHAFEDIRADAQKHRREPIDDGLRPGPVPGTPYSWKSDNSDTVPLILLVPASQQQARQALAFSGQWLIFLLAVWTVALSGVLRTLVRWLWPEQVVLLGLVGWQVAGPTLVVVLLLSLGVLGRLVSAGYLTRWLFRRSRRATPAGSSLRTR